MTNLQYKHNAIPQIQSIAYALHPHTMTNEAALTLWDFWSRIVLFSREHFIAVGEADVGPWQCGSAGDAAAVVRVRVRAC